MKSQMREADHHGARYVLILGENELAQGVVAVKPLVEGEEQATVALGDIVGWLQARLR
jgi:histidyl-tRNA synthetase